MRRTVHSRPELKVFADGITFKYPAPRGRRADLVHREISSEIFGAFLGVPILAILGMGLVLFGTAAPMADPGARWALSIVGGLFVAAAVLAAFPMAYQILYREREVQRRLDPIPVELRVEQRRLIRRYASGREEVWPRDQIDDVTVLTLTTAVGGESDESITFCQLTLLLRDRNRRDHGKRSLAEQAAPGSLEEEDLHWMAKELRGALQVPYDAPPAPLDGAALEHTAEEFLVRLPHVDPETAWRDQWRGFVWMGVFFDTILGTIWGFGHGWALFFDEVGTEAWQNALFLVVCMFLVGSSFGGIALAAYFRKASVMGEFANQTPIALGVRTGMLFRRYASGREDHWPATAIAGLYVGRTGSKKKSAVGVFLQPKQGKPIHLHGKVDPESYAELQPQGLRWLAEELGKALGFVRATPPAGQVHSPATAIDDFAAPARADAIIQRSQGQSAIVEKQEP